MRKIKLLATMSKCPCHKRHQKLKPYLNFLCPPLPTSMNTLTPTCLLTSYTFESEWKNETKKKGIKISGSDLGIFPLCPCRTNRPPPCHQKFLYLPSCSPPTSTYKETAKRHQREDAFQMTGEQKNSFESQWRTMKRQSMNAFCKHTLCHDVWRP